MLRLPLAAATHIRRAPFPPLISPVAAAPNGSNNTRPSLPAPLPILFLYLHFSPSISHRLSPSISVGDRIAVVAINVPAATVCFAGVDGTWCVINGKHNVRLIIAHVERISRARVRDGGALLHRRSGTAPCTRVSSPAADVERERHATMNATQMLDAIAMKERRRNGPAWRAFGRRSAVDAQVHVDGQLLPAVPTSCPLWHCVREKGNCCVLFCKLGLRGHRACGVRACTATKKNCY